MKNNKYQECSAAYYYWSVLRLFPYIRIFDEQKCRYKTGDKQIKTMDMPESIVFAIYGFSGKALRQVYRGILIYEVFVYKLAAGAGSAVLAAGWDTVIFN